MITLLLETSTSRGLLALCRGETTLYQEEFAAASTHSYPLFPTIEKALATAQIDLRQITSIIVGAGPGSYTGIRVGVSIAQALSYALNIRAASICSLQAFIPEQHCTFAALIDAKIGGIYSLLGVKNESGISYLTSPAIEPVEDLQRRLSRVEVIVSPAVAPLKKRLQGEWLWVESAPNVQQMLSCASHQPSNIEILYLRKTQAEIEKEADRKR